MRELRGVYYTPEQVVSYIVGSVDYLLKTRFNRSKGLADENTLVLDPAVGTATFLYFVIQHIYEEFTSQKGAWDDYIGRHLLGRIFGFELLMAPYAVAHLKLGMQLQETGYRFASDQRLEIYLTNTLEEAAAKTEQLMAKFISDEANAAAKIKRDLPILVVLGNPPYSGHSANRSWVKREVRLGDTYTVVKGGPLRSQKSIVTVKAKKKKTIRERTFIGQLVDDYYYVDDLPLGEKNPKWLQDDYVKFIRFAQWRIDKTKHGILTLITNHGYLENPTFRGMRRSLMRSFPQIYVYDLHGNSKRKEKAPDGTEDKNVFDIQQGVAIIVAVRPEKTGDDQRVFHSELWGSRKAKYEVLENSDVTTTPWSEVEATAPNYLFVPRDKSLLEEYEKGWSINDVMPANSLGVVTARDSLAIQFSKEEVKGTIQRFANMTPEEARVEFRLGEDTRDWSVERAQRDLLKTGLSDDNIVPILYCPFDLRFTYYTGNSRGFQCMPRGEIMRHMLAGRNLVLSTTRRVEIDAFERIFCSTHIAGHHAVSLKEVNYVLPVYLYGRNDSRQTSFGGMQGARLNLNRDFVHRFARELKASQQSTDIPEGIEPEHIASYAYATLHSPSYRSRYSDLLQIDFPRVPLTSDRELYAALAAKGASLVALHTMGSAKLNEFITSFPVKGSSVVEKPRYTERDSRAWINPTQYFEGVPRDVWEFHIGGYQVCEKWLKDRKGRQLSYDDIQHYQKIVVALKETIRLMAEIDALIPSWPLP
jgi:predicted helicase